MPKNSFKENRRVVQKAFNDHSLLLPLTRDNVPYIIIEENNKQGDGKLRIVNLDIPATDTIRPISYVLDTELRNKLFSGSENQKKVERVLLVMSDATLYIIMVEMKTALVPATIAHIEGKIQDTISKLILFLPYYLFDSSDFDGYKIEYHCLVFYNNESVNSAIKSDPALSNNDLVKILQDRQKSFWVRERIFGKEYKVRTVFKQNDTDNKEEFTINIDEFFNDDYGFLNANYSEKTLPTIT